jgi:hypothetical protein
LGFPDHISPFIFEHDFEATGLESGLASKLMLGGGVLRVVRAVGPPFFFYLCEEEKWK